MNTNLQHAAVLVGRVAVALLFLWSGWDKIANFAGAAGYMAKAGLPLVQPLLVGSIIVELGGAILLVVGWETRSVAAALAAYTFAITLIFHNFWAYPGADAYGQTIHFFKNLSIIGGMLVLTGCGAGRYSLDRKRV